MAVVHPILDYIARSACSTLPLRSMVAVVLPLFRGWGGRTTARTVAAFIGFRLQAHNLIVVQLHVPNVRKHRATIRKTPTMAVPGQISRPEKAAFNPA